MQIINPKSKLALANQDKAIILQQTSRLTTANADRNWRFDGIGKH